MNLKSVFIVCILLVDLFSVSCSNMMNDASRKAQAFEKNGQEQEGTAGQTEQKPENKNDEKPAPVPKTEPEIKSNPKTKPNPEPGSKPRQKPEPKPKQRPHPRPEPVSNPVPISVPEDATEADHIPEVIVNHDPVETYSISGSINNCKGLKDLRIRINNTEYECKGDGTFLIEGLEAGEYRISSSISGVSAVPEAYNVAIHTSDITDITFFISDNSWILQTENEYGCAYLDIIETNESYIAAGYVGNAVTGDDALLSAYSLNGEQLWQKVLENSGDDEAVSLVSDSSGNLYVAVNDICYDAIAGYGGSCIRVLKMDGTGTVIYDTVVGGMLKDSVKTLCVNSEGELYAAGSTRSLAVKGGEDAVIYKFDIDGNVVWCKITGDSGDDCFIKSVLDKDGNILLVGNIYDSATKTDLIKLVKYSSIGNLLESRIFYSEYNEYASSLISNSGIITICGYAEKRTSDSDDPLIIVCDLDELAEVYYYSFETDTEFTDVSVSHNSSIILLGSSRKTTGYRDRDLFVLELDNNFETVFEKYYNSNIVNDEPAALLKSSFRGYIVLGNSYYDGYPEGNLKFLPEWN